MSGKLTNPQRALLEELGKQGAKYVSDSYEPGKKLVALALAERVEGRFGSYLKVTDLGRALLDTHTGEAGE